MRSVPTILCVGTVALDLILVSPRVPAADERIEATDVALSGGGNAANAAVTIARLGLPVEFCGTVGMDRAGDIVVAELESHGVGVGLIERRAGATTAQSAVIVSSDTGERAIVTHPAPLAPPIPQGFRIVHLDKAGWRSMPAAGLPDSVVSIDDGNLIPDLDLAKVDWYVPTAAVLRTRYGLPDAIEAARHARAAGASFVIATEGAKGSFGLDREGQLHFARSLPVRPRSTLGAGDVFHGALVAALAQSRPLVQALQFANVTAALSCRGLDGRSAVPDAAEVELALTSLDLSRPDDSEIARNFSL